MRYISILIGSFLVITLLSYPIFAKKIVKKEEITNSGPIKYTLYEKLRFSLKSHEPTKIVEGNVNYIDIYAPLIANDLTVKMHANVMGNAEINNSSFDKLKVNGNLKAGNIKVFNNSTINGNSDITNSEFNSLNVNGNFNSNGLKITNKLDIHGNAEHINAEINIADIYGNFKANKSNYNNISIFGNIDANYITVTDKLSVYGSLDLINNRINDLYIHKNKNTISQYINIADSNIKNITLINENPNANSSPELHLSNSHIEGKIIFQSNNGIVYKDSKSTLHEVVGGKIVEK